MFQELSTYFMSSVSRRTAAGEDLSYLYLRKAFANSLTKTRNIMEVKNRQGEGWMIGMPMEIVYRWSDDVK
jgi:hypothetical protein